VNNFQVAVPLDVPPSWLQMNRAIHVIYVHTAVMSVDPQRNLVQMPSNQHCINDNRYYNISSIYL
jgi:hypothetical protein